MHPDLDARLILALASAAVVLGIAIAREIANRRRLRRLAAEMDLREQRLRQVVHSSPTAMVVFDDRGLVRSLNSAAERLFSATEDEVLGHNFQLLVRFREAAPVLNFQSAARLHIDLKATGCRRNGVEFPAEVIITQLFPGPGDAFVAFISEVRDEWEQRTRLDTLERAARRLAVDLNEVLTKIVGYSDLLRDSVEECHREDFCQITEAGQRAAALGSQLLDLSRNDRTMTAAAGATSPSGAKRGSEV
jgi:PAS domain S-box-containing protein